MAPLSVTSILDIQDASNRTGSTVTGTSWLRNEPINLVVNGRLISQLLHGWNGADPFAVARQRKNARAAVTAAIAAGMLCRPPQCSVCGEQEVERVGALTARGEPAIRRMEAHHEDYNKPLAVRWLCSRCHRDMDRARRLRDRERPAGDNFAAFLLVNGPIQLPFRDDPPQDVGANGDLVGRAIRSFRFAGFDDARQSPWVIAVLSCRHEALIHPSELSTLSTISDCYACLDAKRKARRDRAERARQRRAASRASVAVGGSL